VGRDHTIKGQLKRIKGKAQSFRIIKLGLKPEVVLKDVNNLLGRCTRSAGGMKQPS
jgi:hypothetical protein